MTLYFFVEYLEILYFLYVLLYMNFFVISIGTSNMTLNVKKCCKTIILQHFSLILAYRRYIYCVDNRRIP